jgi:hypothetical protein
LEAARLAELADVAHGTAILKPRLGIMINRQLFLQVRDLLHTLHEEPENHLLVTLALMVSGLFLGRNVQFWELALWMPTPIQLTSAVRRFERFVADPAVDVAAFFEPFVLAMQASLGQETAYLILDCTQAGRQCRTLVAALAYHETVLPLAWQSIRGKKGHVTGEFQKALLNRIYPYLKRQARVVVLGDAEYSNEAVITWLRSVHWDFVLHIRTNCLVRTTDDPAWQPVQELVETSQLQHGQVQHWALVCFTQEHRLADLTLSIYWGIGEDEPLCLVSNLPAGEAPHLIYERRFWIETLFGSYKSRAFGLARTHLTHPEHIDRLVLAIAIATCVTLGLGTQLVLDRKTYLVDRSERRDLSLFQIGWRWLYRLLALNRLQELRLRFSWAFRLPAPGFRSAK